MSHLPDQAAAASSPDPRDGGASEATKERLLAAAERLLAERGFAGMSIRALARHAGTSVSAAHYHFGSKLALVEALFESRIEPINAQRIERLNALLAAAPDGRPTLEAVLDSFLRPSFDAWRQGEALGRTATPHILAQVHADRSPRLADLKRRLLGPLMDRYVGVIDALLPDKDPASLRNGLQFVLGISLHVVGGHLEREAGGRSTSPREDEALIEQMIRFAAAGLRACEAKSSEASS